jgi:hypothetical protein
LPSDRQSAGDAQWCFVRWTFAGIAQANLANRTRSQGGTFHGSLSGRENVAFIARVYGASVRHTTRYVEEFAELGGYFEMPVEAAP